MGPIRPSVPPKPRAPDAGSISAPAAVSKREGAGSVPAWAWPLLTALVACVPFFRGLSLTNVFHVRDLSMFFWPRHLWIRESLLRGVAPWWDPYAAGGQPVYPDALNQLFLLPVALFRVALPAIVGFNLMVVTPFPLAGLGAWLFLRRHFSPVSAAHRCGRLRGERASGLHQQLPEHVVVHRLDSVDAVGGGARSPQAFREEPGDSVACRRGAGALGRARDHGRHRGARSGVCDVLRR